MIRRSFVRGLMVSAIAAGAAAFPIAAESQTTKDTDRIQLIVSGYPQGLHALPYEIAMDKGIFMEHGIEVARMFGSQGGGTTARSLLAGKMEFGVISLASIIQAFQAGAPLVIVAGGSDSLGHLHWVQRTDTSFKTPRDLVGHIWGYTNPGSVTDAASRLIFEKAGVNLDEVTFKATGGVSAGLTLLKAGEVDASPLDDPTFTIQTAGEGRWREVLAVSDYVDKVQQDAIVTSPHLIETNPDLVKRFLAAIQEAEDWLYGNPEEAAVIFAKYAEIDPKIAEAAIKDLIPSRWWSIGLSKEGIENMIHGAQLAGALKAGRPIQWGELLNQSMLPSGVATVEPTELPEYAAE